MLLFVKSISSDQGLKLIEIFCEIDMKSEYGIYTYKKLFRGMTDAIYLTSPDMYLQGLTHTKARLLVTGRAKRNVPHEEIKPLQIFPAHSVSKYTCIWSCWLWLY